MCDFCIWNGVIFPPPLPFLFFISSLKVWLGAFSPRHMGGGGRWPPCPPPENAPRTLAINDYQKTSKLVETAIKLHNSSKIPVVICKILPFIKMQHCYWLARRFYLQEVVFKVVENISKNKVCIILRWWKIRERNKWAGAQKLKVISFAPIVFLRLNQFLLHEMGCGILCT